MKKIFSIYLIIALLSYPLSSCMSGQAAGSRALSDSGATDTGDGWEFDPNDPFGGLDGIDTTDTDGDGVYDWIEEEYGSDPNDPNSIPDLESALGYDASLDSSGLDSLADTLGGLTISLATTLISWGLTANAVMCVTPGPGKGNIETTDQEALIGASFAMVSSEAAGAIKFDEQTRYYLTTVIPDFDDPFTETGYFKIIKGKLILKPVGKACVYTYKASIQEITCEPCVTTDFPISDALLTMFGDTKCTSNTKNQVAGTYMGWQDPIETSTLLEMKIEGIDSQSKAEIIGLYTNARAGQGNDMECDEVSKSETMTIRTMAE
ncbi:MAG: hypothetical protein ABIA04_11915 [Pseudomonadota bacterium]